MPTASAAPSGVQNQALYRATLQQAAADGPVLMGKMVAAARLVLHSHAAAAHDVPARNALDAAANLLRQYEPQLGAAYSQALLAAFLDPRAVKPASAQSVADVPFIQLERMDDAQVQASVSLARVQQIVSLATQASVADLHALVGGMLGLHSVQADANPLRPQTYVHALKAAVAHTQVPVVTQLQWFNAMAASLGQELRTTYLALCSHLRQQGVVPAAPSSASDTRGSPEAASAAGATGSAHASLLTLDKLRKLLSGELAALSSGSRVELFAAQFAQQFETRGTEPDPPNSGFDSTVPAALQALTEMKQVAQVVHTLEQRRNAGAQHVQPHDDSIEGQRLALRRTAKGLAQALSLEVVTLMVDNLAQDARLLEPVRQMVRQLEPPLLRLALVDQRFFMDKQHPARRLLHELTHRSMAFDAVSASGFDAFVQQAQQHLAPLYAVPIDSAEVFERQLTGLQQAWQAGSRMLVSNRDAAVEVLQHAEARNLLAQQIARDIQTQPDAEQVAQVVLDFLCGPWAQVVAQARIRQGVGAAATEKYEALIPALLWSAHPQMALSNPARLTRLVPRLLGTLREGLETIRYPATRTSQFFERLMAIHQLAFRAVQATPAVAEVGTVLEQPGRTLPSDDDEPWMPPQEAQATNFVALQETPLPEQPGDAPVAPVLLDVSAPAAAPELDMPLGSWVELWANGSWARTQLTWASPHGTLYLFTGAYGNSQSMSRRSRDKLWLAGKLRVISGHPLDSEALDAVAQAALRNSMDSHWQSAL